MRHKGDVEEGREMGWPQGQEGCGQGEFQEQNMSREQEGNGYIEQGHVVLSSGSQDLTQQRDGEVLKLWLEEGKNDGGMVSGNKGNGCSACMTNRT